MSRTGLSIVAAVAAGLFCAQASCASAQSVPDRASPECLRADGKRSAATAATLTGTFDLYLGTGAVTPDSVLWLASRLELHRVHEGTVDFDGRKTLPVVLIGSIWTLANGVARESTLVLVPDAVLADAPDQPVRLLRVSPRATLFRGTHDLGLDLASLRLTPSGFAGRWTTGGSYLAAGRAGDFCAVRRPP